MDGTLETILSHMEAYIHRNHFERFLAGVLELMVFARGNVHRLACPHEFRPTPCGDLRFAADHEPVFGPMFVNSCL